jgi:hypothetical protein
LFNPGVDLTNLGVDTNVFNQPAGQAQRDFTFTLTPKTDLWMKFGPTWITGNVREDVLWYETYATQRAANTSATVSLIVPFNRLSFKVGAGYIHARERPGYEIDARVPRTERQFNGAAEVRALSRTFFGVQGSRQKVDFATDASFLDSSLAFELNRVSTAGSVNVRYALTPLTSITADAGRSEDRFQFSPLRDANSTTAGVQLTFDPSAVIKGSARVGYRDFEPIIPSVPRYRGSTVAVDLSYVLLGTMKFGIQLTRDVQFSYDVNQPYYLQSGISTSIAQQIYGPVDVVAGLGFYSLAYRDRTGATVLYPGRTDTNRSLNGGVGYHLSSDLRVGVRVEKQWRVSDIALHEFQDFRIGLSVTYGS